MWVWVWLGMGMGRYGLQSYNHTIIQSYNRIVNNRILHTHTHTHIYLFFPEVVRQVQDLAV
jgi:hypothetical protein